MGGEGGKSSAASAACRAAESGSEVEGGRGGGVDLESRGLDRRGVVMDSDATLLRMVLVEEWVVGGGVEGMAEDVDGETTEWSEVPPGVTPSCSYRSDLAILSNS